MLQHFSSTQWLGSDPEQVTLTLLHCIILQYWWLYMPIYINQISQSLNWINFCTLCVLYEAEHTRKWSVLVWRTEAYKQILSCLCVLTCRLEELFLCLNEYSSVSASSVACPSLRLLHITDNSLKDWAEVRKFGSMFPSLDTLVMANNNLASIQDNKDILPRLFPNLRSINLHNSGQWSSVMCFNNLMV